MIYRQIHFTPPKNSRLITKRVAAALALIEVRVLDHCIVAGAEILSFAEQGLL
jgi:DNA repair protein RadC